MRAGNPSGDLDPVHIVNFLDAIRKGESLNSDILNFRLYSLMII